MRERPCAHAALREGHARERVRSVFNIFFLFPYRKWTRLFDNVVGGHRYATCRYTNDFSTGISRTVDDDYGHDIRQFASYGSK